MQIVWYEQKSVETILEAGKENRLGVVLDGGKNKLKKRLFVGVPTSRTQS